MLTDKPQAFLYAEVLALRTTLACFIDLSLGRNPNREAFVRNLHDFAVASVDGFQLVPVGDADPEMIKELVRDRIGQILSPLASQPGNGQ